MNILVVDQDCLLAADRGLYRAVDAVEQGWLTLLVPSRWKEIGTVVRAEEGGDSLNVLTSSVLFPGKSHRAVYRSLARIMVKLRPSVLYINAEPESYLAWQSAVLIRRCSLPTRLVFMSWRNIDYPQGEFPYKAAWLNARAERTVLKMARHCVARTAEAAGMLKRRGFTETTVIPPSVDTTVFSPVHPAAGRTGASDMPVIGFVGRLIALKGVDLLLRAVARLPRPVRLLLVGDGPERGALRALSRDLGIAATVEWTGSVSHSIIPSLLQRMDVLVLPSKSGTSWKEQFGRVLIESMASGVPVIGSSSGEIPRVIAGAGLVFQEGDVEGLSTHLDSLISNEGMRWHFRESGLRRVQEHFAIPSVAKRYVDLFRRLGQGET